MAALALFLAAVLAISALHKGLAPQRLAPVAARLASLPAALGGAALALAGSVEALSALALAIPATRSLGAIAALALWSVYAFALLRQRGQVLDCGCELFSRERPVDGFAILRPVLLAALAFVLFLAGSAPFTIDAPFAALALLALWFAAGELHAIPSLSKDMKR